MKKIAIIGTGLSGLTVAHYLKERAEITLFEKARGVGGRSSSSRAEPYFFDHGAQYFTARTDTFRRFLKPLLKTGVVQRWNAHYCKFDREQIIERKDWGKEEPRYVGIPGMNFVAKYLATNLSVVLKTKITRLELEKTKQKWQLFDQDERAYSGFDWIISTAPSPQTLELLPAEFAWHSEIKKIKMHPCFCLMLGFSQSLPFEFSAAHFLNSALSWIAVNNDKPARPKNSKYSLTVHSSTEFAQEFLEKPPAEVIRELKAELERIFKYDFSKIEYQSLHNWRFANSFRQKSSNILIDSALNLGACGDWCSGGRFEGAFTSAFNFAQALEKLL